jgi:hypothetical protein
LRFKDTHKCTHVRTRTYTILHAKGNILNPRIIPKLLQRYEMFCVCVLNVFSKDLKVTFVIHRDTCRIEIRVKVTEGS